MNPEDKLRRLRDESLWKEVRVPRGRTTPRPEHRSAWRLAIPVLSGLAIGALLVTGINVWGSSMSRSGLPIAPTASLAPTGVPSAPATPAPSATPTATSTTPPAAATDEPPAQLFAGNCENVLPDATVDTIAKTNMSNDPALVAEVMGDYDGLLTGARGFVTREVGGLNCAWFSQKEGTLISFTFVPADRVAALDEPEQCARGAGGWSGCSTDLIENGVRIIGMVGQTGGPEDARISNALLDVIKPAIAGLGDVSGTEPAPGHWPLPVDCTALGTASGLGKPVEIGGDASPSIVYANLLNDGLRLRCDWTAGIVEYRPGGAWAEPEIAELDGAEEIHVDGFDHVIKVPGSYQTVYHFFRGTNWLFVDQSPSTEHDITRFATKVADGLDQL